MSYTFEFEGIGTHWWIELFEEPYGLKTTQNKIHELVLGFDNNYSRFKEESWVFRLNQQKKILGFPAELVEILTYYSRITRLTDGHFTPFVGELLDNIGYDKEFSFKARNIRQPVPSEFLELSSQSISIAKNAKIDIGGIGKGWLIDKIKELLLGEGLKYFVINGGGDIYATSDFGKEIKFLLENPFDSSQSIGEIWVKDGAIASSSYNRRRWVSDGKEFNHLIDARSGESLFDLAAVFTYAKTALAADTASTAIYVSSPKLLERIAADLQVEYMLVSPEGKMLKSDNYHAHLN